ncbi:MAG TPA: SapC family protein, partial [Rheinheimera sp.]|nr:SapC family protein [Rheinheimera sp.]
MTSTPKIVPLTKEQHAATKINNNNAFSHISDEHMLPVVVHEFVSAGAEFPIVFIKTGETYQPVAMLGLSAKQNLFLQGDKWQALYVPRAV